MDPATYQCSGCGREFAPGGYSNHLRLSTDPRCNHIWAQFTPNYSSALLNPPNQPATSSVDHDVPMLDASNEALEFDSGSRTIPSSPLPPSPHHHRILTSNIFDQGDSEDEGDIGDEDDVGHIDPSLETTHSSSQPLVTVIDLDEEPESGSSDDEEEGPQPHPSNSLQDSTQGPSNTQTGRNVYL
jgi:hypothetical protein